MLLVYRSTRESVESCWMPKRDVFWEVSVVASALSIQDPREPGFSNETVIDPSSEFVTLLNLWNRVEESRDALSLEISSMVFSGRAELQ